MNSKLEDMAEDISKLNKKLVLMYSEKKCKDKPRKECDNEGHTMKHVT